MRASALFVPIIAATLMLPAFAAADEHIRVTVIVDDHDHHHEKIHPAFRPDRFHRPRVVIHDHDHHFHGHHGHVSRHGRRIHDGGHHGHGGFSHKRTATVNMPQ